MVICNADVPKKNREEDPYYHQNSDKENEEQDTIELLQKHSPRVDRADLRGHSTIFDWRDLVAILERYQTLDRTSLVADRGRNPCLDNRVDYGKDAEAEEGLNEDDEH
ncbi:hypothetical protein DPMN_140437 [Dreissena polymorpha]|uniref:Uncharacterized protein n=1 Tax=Dreissena polymorpha TaxID=45954 RepID=A0A9D4JGN9_DREPO|nr:hypothetical protein DPMN_140437 [Dreissena polymorpha]